MGNAAYNKEYARQRYSDFRARKDTISLDVFGGHCFLCGDARDYQKYHLHHVVYEATSDYRRNSKAQWTRELRLQEAEANPEHFVLLCPRCHRLVTGVGNYLLRRFEILHDVDVMRFLYLVNTEFENRFPQEVTNGEGLQR